MQVLIGPEGLSTPDGTHISMIRHLPIIGKVLLVVGLFAVASIASTVFSEREMTRISAGYDRAIDGEGATALLTTRANKALTTVRAAIGDLQISTTDAGNRQALDEMQAARADFVSSLDAADRANRDGSLGLRELKARGIEVVDTICKTSIDMGMAATAPQDVIVAQAEDLKSCSPVLQALAQSMNQVTERAIQDQNGSRDDLRALTGTTAMIVYAGTLGSLLVVVALAVWAIRAWVSRPIGQLAATMQRLAGGDLSVAVAGGDRRDEIGAMARTIQVFKDAGDESRAMQREAEILREAARAADERSAREQSERAAQLSLVVEALAVGLRRLSSGDLLFRVDAAFAADYERLKADFNGAMAKLQETMTVVAGNTSGIRSGSHEISSAADDLSRRTERQAASLEETAAALDEITATMRRTSEGAGHVRKVVSAAREGAERSGIVVRRAITAMDGIARSSAEIGQIIGVIDEIAFQTNLLALNAGVEAARAGEAGRGFAVVASEVRALAQRSADAAKEIKTLISSSGLQVTEGVELVARTGETLREIVGQVAEITTIVADISASIQEQSTALGEVNTAINQMDQVTQQNAAMVEQSTAASHSLDRESEDLARIVGTFQIGAAAPAGRPATGARRQPAAAALKIVGRGGAALRAGRVAAEGDWAEF